MPASSTLHASSTRVSVESAVGGSLLKVVREAGGRGATAAGLRLERPRGKVSATAPLPPRRAALASLIEEGRVVARSDGSTPRFILKELAPDAGRVAEKIMTLPAGAAGGSLVLWRAGELTRILAAHERPWLAAALALLEERRELLRVTDGSGGERFLFAVPLRRWLDGGGKPPAVPPPSGAGADAELLAVYTRAVRESGGFPDVKISALEQALPPAGAAGLSERLRALWRDGRVTLSLGDWSLAGEDTRRAAVEMEGERYLFVRFEQDAAGEELSSYLV